MLLTALGMSATNGLNDSLRTVELNDVNIMSTRATKTTPVAYTDISKEQIEEVLGG